MILRLLLLLIFISVNSYAVVKQYLSNNQYTRKTGEITAEELLSPLPDDKSIGDPKAPILMIEYASTKVTGASYDNASAPNKLLE